MKRVRSKKLFLTLLFWMWNTKKWQKKTKKLISYSNKRF
jgi:hypothetical protein